jgi:hemerythrin-like domain-containing protein
MAVQINRAMADFDHPLEMLTACHERIEAHSETLRRLAEHVPLHGCDAQAQQAASNVMRYFDSAGRHHREDEEQDLFPGMIAAAQGESAERIALLVGQLAHEHNEIEKAWIGLRDALESIAHGETALLNPIEVGRFCGMYRAHMALEEANLFPLAELLLEAGALEDLGKAMAKRRGVKAAG